MILDTDTFLPVERLHLHMVNWVAKLRTVSDWEEGHYILQVGAVARFIPGIANSFFWEPATVISAIYIPHSYSYLVGEQLALILFQEDCLLQEEEFCQLCFFASRLLFAFLLWISASHLPFRFSIPTEKLFVPSCFFPISHIKERKYHKAKTSITFLKVSEIIIYVSVVNPFYPLKDKMARLETWLDKHNCH